LSEPIPPQEQSPQVLLLLEDLADALSCCEEDLGTYEEEGFIVDLVRNMTCENTESKITDEQQVVLVSQNQLVSQVSLCRCALAMVTIFTA